MKLKKLAIQSTTDNKTVVLPSSRTISLYWRESDYTPIAYPCF